MLPHRQRVRRNLTGTRGHPSAHGVMLFWWVRACSPHLVPRTRNLSHSRIPVSLTAGRGGRMRASRDISALTGQSRKSPGASQIREFLGLRNEVWATSPHPQVSARRPTLAIAARPINPHIDNTAVELCTANSQILSLPRRILMPPLHSMS